MCDPETEQRRILWHGPCVEFLAAHANAACVCDELRAFIRHDFVHRIRFCECAEIWTFDIVNAWGVPIHVTMQCLRALMCCLA